MTAAALVAPPAPDPDTSALIRVLIVDDSAVMRAIFVRTLGACADLRIVGQVAGARGAIECLRDGGVDVILLDLEMPGMDGFAALPLLIGAGRGARVLVVSSGSAGEAGARARQLGADETLQKPRSLDYEGAFSKMLLDRVRWCGRRERESAPEAIAPKPAVPAASDRAVHSSGGGGSAIASPAVIGIAASAGGVAASSQLLSALPADFETPILVTQHLPATFLPFFAAQLGEATGRPVRVAETGMPLLDGHILVAPGHAHLTLAKTSSLIHVRLNEAPAPSGCRPSADPMFVSLARLYGQRACGVILSGMGRDGAEGAQAIADAGGTIFAQDQASSVVWGMPGVAVGRGLARAVLPPAEIARALAASAPSGMKRWS